MNDHVLKYTSVHQAAGLAVITIIAIPIKKAEDKNKGTKEKKGNKTNLMKLQHAHGE